MCFYKAEDKTGIPSPRIIGLGIFYWWGVYIVEEYTKDVFEKELIQRAISLMHNDFNKELTLEKVARECGFSKFYFSRIFKKYTGKNFKIYLIELRINRAKELLMHSKLPISQICYQTGFNDLSYFSRVFKKIVGLSPSEFRQRIKDDGKPVRK